MAVSSSFALDLCELNMYVKTVILRIMISKAKAEEIGVRAMLCGGVYYYYYWLTYRTMEVARGR